jgi:SOS-response transcriptional repressor LexA
MAVELRAGHYSVLEASLPGQPPTPVGVILADPTTGEVAFKARHDFQTLDPEDSGDAEVLELFTAQLAEELQSEGLAALERLEAAASNAIQISDRQPTLIGNFSATLLRLYQRLVPVLVVPFKTHVPLYSCRAAAGSFSDLQRVSQEEGDLGWIELPSGKAREGLFAAEVTGRSMEPRIADGSLCLFRAPVIGSRHGRLVLVENLAEAEEGGERYTIKRYHRPPGKNADSYRGVATLQPLNPEFEPWQLDAEAAEAGRIRVIAEFVDVLR